MLYWLHFKKTVTCSVIASLSFSMMHISSLGLQFQYSTRYSQKFEDQFDSLAVEIDFIRKYAYESVSTLAGLGVKSY